MWKNVTKSLKWHEFCDDELKVNGYDFIRKDRQTHSGGLIIYIKSYLSFTHHVDRIWKPMT